MKYGDRITIFGQEYSIKIRKNVVLNSEEVEGYINVEKKEIHINKSSKPKQRLKTLFHEVGHAIIHETSLDQVIKDDTEEIIVDNFAKGFARLLVHLTHEN